MRVFLTGVSGGLGTLLANRLAALPEIECITGIDLTEPGRALPSKVDFVRMDIRSSDVPVLMAGHDTVIHTAFMALWQAKVPAAERDDINVNGVRNVARAAVASGVRKFIHASSTAAYEPCLVAGQTSITEEFPIGTGEKGFYYCNGKAMGERILGEILGPTEVHLTLLRPVSFVGPNTAHLLCVVRDTAAQILAHNPRIQLCQEEDVAAAFIKATCTEMPGAYNVAPDDYIRDRQMWRIMNKKWTATLPWFVVTRYVFLRWRYFGAMTHPNWISARMADFTVSNSKLKATGWKSRYRSADALRTAL